MNKTDSQNNENTMSEQIPGAKSTQKRNSGYMLSTKIIVLKYIDNFHNKNP